MRKPLLSSVTLLCTIVVFAQTQGPNSGTFFTNVAIPGSNKSWANFKLGGSDDTYATYGSLTGSDPSYSDYVKTTGYGFSIPGGVTIKGIVVEIERSDPDQRTADYRIRIVKGGSIGNSERSTGIAYPATDVYQSYGSSSDLWGEFWTAADINSLNFGVAVAAVRTSTSPDANAGRIDHIRITVYYNFLLLPVRLSEFTIQKNGSVVDINWVTSDESNMNHYEVERSVNGTVFITLQNINSRNQANTANYSSSDQHPNKGVNYYRLKMIANDGRVTYSKIAAVHFSSGKNVVLYPNPWIKGTELNITNLNGDLIMVDYYSPGGQLLGTSASAGRTVSTSALLHVKGLVLYKLRNKEGYTIGTGTLQVY